MLRHLSVAEVSHTCERHCESQAVGGCNHFGITHTAARLNDRRGTRFRDYFKPVYHRPHGFHGAEARRVHTAHLTRSNADALAVPFVVARVDDRV